MPTPQQHATVEILGPEADPIAVATCFYSVWESDGGVRWRGFLTRIDPAGVLALGESQLLFPSGAEATIGIERLAGQDEKTQPFIGFGSAPDTRAGSAAYWP